MTDPPPDPNDPWPWDQAPNAAALTVATVLAGAPVLFVTHDEDDDGWQFLDGEPVAVASGRVIGMREVLRLDPTLREVADLPPGWSAWRDRIGGSWTRAPRRPAEGD